MSKTLLFLMLISISFCVLLFAGTTGKIAGRITDAETGQSLPGVNVVVEGTSLGAATNLLGDYVILNIPPGTYDLRVTMIGYAEYRIKNIRVIIDQTAHINAELKPAALSGEEVVIIAERPLIDKDVSNSQMNIEAVNIETMPIQTVKEALTLQAGIEKDRQGIVVRGSGANQTVFMVDGFSMNDERSNIPYTTISMSSINEIQIQTGGFNAEYGNARSGLVNSVTNEGRRDKYSAIAIVHYRPAAPKHFGRSLYDSYSYFNRPYLDPAVCWTGTKNGAWDEDMQKQYPYFEGWNVVSATRLNDNDPTNDLTPEGAKRLYEWQHRRQGDIKKPDYLLDLGLGGPVPVISKNFGDLRFHLSHIQGQDMFAFPLSTDSYRDNQSRINLTTNVTSSIKLNLTGSYGEIHSVCPYDWQTTPTGRVISTQDEVAGLLNGTNGNSILYMPGYYSPSSIYRTIFNVKITHQLGSKTYYEIRLQNMINRYNTYKMTDRDTTKKYEPIPGYFVDEAPYGYWGYGVNGIDDMIMGGWMNLGRDRSVNSTTSFKFDITSQIDLRNEIKSGLEIVYNDFNIKSATESPSMSTWTRSMVYHIFPYRASAYVHDKIEFQGFIANVGARLDYYNSNTEWYQLTDYDKYYKSGKGDLLETNAPKKDIKPELNLSPRLGISHPITENSKLYFNYDHFRSEPQSSARFRIQRESNGLVTDIGDPGLKPEKTVAYELGFEQNLLDLFSLNVAAYYKDITNQADWIRYKGLRDINYNKAANNNYQDIRGFEVTLTKRVGPWITGFINFTYDVRTSGYFGLKQYFEDPMEQYYESQRNLYQEKPLPRPFARANIAVHSPADFGPVWLYFRPLSDWNFNILAEWKTGRHETYNPKSIPGIVDDVHWKDFYNVDLRISKLFKISSYNIQFYVDMTNIFNIKYMTAGLINYRNYVGFADQYDYNDYLVSLNFPWEEGVEHGHDKLGDYRPAGVAYDPLEQNPNNDPEIKAKNDTRKKNKSYIDNPNIEPAAFLNPRDISLGIIISF